MARYEHMSWCVGVHDEHGECEIRRGNCDARSDEPGVYLNGVPCDHVYLQVNESAITEPDQIAAMMGWLVELQTKLTASVVETDCDQHYHNFDHTYTDHADGCPYMLPCPVCDDGLCARCDAVEYCDGGCLP